MRMLYVQISQRNFFLQSHKNEIGHIKYHIYFTNNLIQIFLREYDVPEDMITKFLS